MRAEPGYARRGLPLSPTTEYLAAVIGAEGQKGCGSDRRLEEPRHPVGEDDMRATAGGLTSWGNGPPGAHYRSSGFVKGISVSASSGRRPRARAPTSSRAARGPRDRMTLGNFSAPGSREQSLHHIPAHVGQPEIAALETVGQSRVVEAHQVQDRGLEVVDAHPVL